MESRWESCDSAEEAKRLVEYMISHPSLDWLPIMNKAEKGGMKYGHALLENSRNFYESIADLLADVDGLVYVPEKKKHP
jgi:hypothetical protein